MKLLLRLIAVPLLFVSASCGDNAAVEPAGRQYSVTPAKLDQLAQYRSGPLQITIGLALKTIGPEGGKISLLGFEVVVPPGAVTKPTRFSIRLPIDPQNSEFVRAQFGPHMTFALPVTLRLPLNGTTAEGDTSARVLWWSGLDWVPFETTPTADGRIETKTTHFSEYGTEGPVARGIILGNRPSPRSWKK